MESDEENEVFASKKIVDKLSQWINSSPENLLSPVSKGEEDSVSALLRDLQQGEKQLEEEFASFLPQKYNLSRSEKVNSEEKVHQPIISKPDVEPTSNEIELAEFIQRNSLLKKFLLLWRYMTSFKIELRHQMKLAQDFRNLMLKATFLHRWKNEFLKAKNRKLENERQKEKMAEESYKGNLLMRAFSAWRLFIIHSKSKKANDALALQRWALSIESKAFQAWKLFCSRYKEKRKKEMEAKKLYKERLIQKAISQWIKFGLEKQYKRDSLLLKRELHKRERIFLLVVKIARKWRSKALESRAKRGSTEPKSLYPMTSPFFNNLYNTSSPIIPNNYIPPFKSSSRTSPIVKSNGIPSSTNARSSPMIRETISNNRKPPKVPFSIPNQQKPIDTLPPTSSREQLLQKLRALANVTGASLADSQKSPQIKEPKNKVENSNQIVPSSRNSSFRSEVNTSSDVDAEMYAIEKRLREIGQEKNRSAQSKLEYEQLIQTIQIQKQQIQLNPKNDQLPRYVQENEKRAKELLKEINDFQLNRKTQIEEIKQLQARIQELKRYT